MVRIGAPLEARAPFAGAKGDRRQMMDVLGGAMAALLPPEYRGVHGRGGPAR